MANEESKPEGGGDRQEKAPQHEQGQRSPPEEEDTSPPEEEYTPPPEEEYTPPSQEEYTQQRYQPTPHAGYTQQQYQPPPQWGGAPSQYGPQQPYPQPAFQVGSLFTKPLLVMAICLGAFIGWIGSLIVIFSSENADIGAFLLSTGALIIFGGSLFGAVACKDFDKWSRLGLLVIAAASLMILSPQSIFIRY